MRKKIKKSKEIIKKANDMTEDAPLIVNFSGGKDSLVLTELVSEVIDEFICFYMDSGIAFDGLKENVRQVADRISVPLKISTPKWHYGGLFERMENDDFVFPTICSIWCVRDLKVMPQYKMLQDLYGKGQAFIKLNGVRKYESNRRNSMYSSNDYFKDDYQVSRDKIVFPILGFTDEDRDGFIRDRNIEVPTQKLYDDFGVSGCYWCPYYQADIYRKILRKKPNLYDEFIEWEEKLDKPCVTGQVWMKNLKEEVVGCEERD